MTRIHLPKQYVNVKIPVELADEVDKILEKKLLGYTVAELNLLLRLSGISSFKSKSNSVFSEHLLPSKCKELCGDPNLLLREHFFNYLRQSFLI